MFIHSPVDGHLDCLIFFSEHEAQRVVKDLFGVESHPVYAMGGHEQTASKIARIVFLPEF